MSMGRMFLCVHSRLKVLSEQDFLAQSKYFIHKAAGDSLNSLSADIFKQVVIPEIERQVNESSDFLKLRQIYQSMILAVWYKKNLRDNFLGEVYLDQSKVSGIDIKDKQEKEKIYQQYLKVFKKGVFNYVKEEYDSVTKELVPRKYFSGGLEGVKEVAEKRDSSQLSIQDRQALPSDKAMDVSVELLGVTDRPPASTPQDRTPYGLDPRENVSRDCFMELDPAYGILELLNDRVNEKQKLLLIGVGRGVSSVELALRYPKVEIWAVNKEDNLWNDGIVRETMIQKGYSDTQITEARSRIKVFPFDAVDVSQSDKVLGSETFDMVFFEPRTQVYFADKVGPIEHFFNRHVKVGGEYGFVTNGIFTSQKAFANSDFRSPIYERNPDPLAVNLIQRAFRLNAQLKLWRKLGGNLYFRYRRTDAADVHIPVSKVKNINFTTPSGLPLVWSMYQPEHLILQPHAQDDVPVSNASAIYKSESEFFDSLILSSHPFKTNPILLLAGDPGSGKTTLAQKYKAHLESNGQEAVIINTDKLFKTKALMFKQAFLTQWLTVPFMPEAARMKAFNMLLVDSERVSQVARQIQEINASAKKEGTIRVAGLPQMHIRAGTVIIIEGSLANVMFSDRLPVTKKVYCKVAPLLQKQRIINRAVEDRGYSPLKSKSCGKAFGRGRF